MKNRFFRKFLAVVLSIVAIVLATYFLFLYESPVDPKALDHFLEGQPIIDVHIHATKGFEGSDVYGMGLPAGTKLDQSKIDWYISTFDQLNIVLGLCGGPIGHVENWIKQDDRFWGGVTFPFNALDEADDPFTKEFLDYHELKELYSSKGFKSMGEAMNMYFGVDPNDTRLDPYWQIASEFSLPVGFHATKLPPPWVRNKDTEQLANEAYSNPELLRPILKKYPSLKLYLMHFCGDYSEESVQLMKDFANVYCDMSAISAMAPKIHWEKSVKYLFDEELGDRLMFGTDYIGTEQAHIEAIFKLKWLTDEQKRDILYNNAAKFLELSPEEIERHYQIATN